MLVPEIERLLAEEREQLQDEIQAYQSDPNYDRRYLQGQDEMRKSMECGDPKACLVEREVTNIEKNEGPLNDTEYCSVCAERERVGRRRDE